MTTLQDLKRKASVLGYIQDRASTVEDKYEESSERKEEMSEAEKIRTSLLSS